MEIYPKVLVRRRKSKYLLRAYLPHTSEPCYITGPKPTITTRKQNAKLFDSESEALRYAEEDLAPWLVASRM